MGSYFGFYGRWDVRKKAGYRPGTLPTLHASFDLDWTNGVGAVPGRSFWVPFRVPESGRYTIAKVADCDSDCRFGIFDHGNNKGVGDGKNAQNPDLKPLGPSNGPPKMAHFGRF